MISDNDLDKIIHINDDGDLPGFAVARGGRPVRGRGRRRRRCATGWPRSAPRCPRRSPAARGSSCCPTGARRADPAGAAGADPVAAAHRRGAPPPDPGADPDPGRADRGVRRRPRVPPHRAADRLRRRRGQPVPGPRDGAGHGPPRRAGRGHRPEGRGEPDQGARQGRAEDHVQDGRVHRRLLHRRADLRGGRAGPGRRSAPASPGPRPGWAASGSTCWPRRPRRGTAGPSRPAAPGRITGGWRPAATTSGAARASRTCSTRRPCSSCSTPPGPGVTRSSRSTPGWWTTSPPG